MHQDQYDVRFKYCFYYSYQYVCNGRSGMGYKILYSNIKKPSPGEALIYILENWEILSHTKEPPIIHDLQAIYIHSPRQFKDAMNKIRQIN